MIRADLAEPGGVGGYAVNCLALCACAACRCRAGRCRRGRSAAAGATANGAGGLRAGRSGLDRHHRRRGPDYPGFSGRRGQKSSAGPLCRCSAFAKRARRRTFSVRATVSALASSISASFSSVRQCKSSIERKASDYAELYGLADVDYALRPAPSPNFWPVSWLRLRGEVRQGIGGETGVTGDIFLDAVVPVGQWTISAGPRVTLQTAAATSPYFSITAAQAITANALQPGLGTLTAYNAGGGLYSYGAGTQLAIYLQPDNGRLTPSSNIERLTGLGCQFAAGDAARLAEPVHFRPRRHLFLQYASAVVTSASAFSVPRAAP